MSKLKSIVEKARKDGDVLAVIVYGSFARGEQYRDLDACVVLKPKSYGRLSLSQKKLRYLSAAPHGVDVKILQQLPAYIQKRVFAEGKVVYAKDRKVLFDVAVDTHRMFEDYKPIYEEYLKGVADAG